MATANKKETVVSFTLDLTADEASALLALTGSVSGNSYDSPRKFTDPVYRALQSAGVEKKYEGKIISGARFDYL